MDDNMNGRFTSGGTILFGVILNILLTTALAVGYSSQGLAEEQALDQAARASEGFVVQTLLSVLQLLFMFWLVRWLVVKTERQKFDWTELGLISANRARHIWLGVILVVAMTLLTVGIVYFAAALKYMETGLHTLRNYLHIAVLAIHNSADERFLGAPLFVFESVSGTTQLVIEFSVILFTLIILTGSALIQQKQRLATDSK